MMKIGIVAGEASGDHLGAELIKSLRESYPDLTVSGVGGPEMIAEGCQSLYPMSHLSMMGIIEPLLHLPELLKIRRGLYRHFLKNRPDVFIGIDSPDFNLGLEIKLRKAKIPVVHYVSPSVWAWRQKRIFKIARAVDLMLTLFPFEVDIYKQHNIPVQFVGHPLADKIPLKPEKLAARNKLDLDPNKIYIAILPGSRGTELKHLAQLYISTAHRIWKLRPGVEFITSAINSELDEKFKKLWRKNVPEIPMKFFQGVSHDVIEAADVVLVTSGTATLETMLYKRPMVIAFKTGKISYRIASHLVKVPFIGLPNLLAKEQLVPEFIQNAATPDKITLALLNYLNYPENVAKLEQKFTEMHTGLRCDASHRAAEAVLKLLQKQEISNV